MHSRQKNWAQHVAQEKSFSEKTKADDKSIGFDYQYYYFLHRILNLKTGQSVGLEVKDDVHSQLDADFNILFQVKHTVQSNAAGAPIALTELDSDLWKTLYNWSQVISDKNESRAAVTAQLRFAAKTEFHLISNKSHSKSNKLVELIEKLQAGESDVQSLRTHLDFLEGKTKDEKIKGYIGAVVKLDTSVLETFLCNIRFELELEDIIGLVKRSLLEKIIDDDKVDAVFQRLDSTIRADNFLAIKRGEPILISFEQFTQRYKRIFDDGRSKKLVQQVFTPELPEDIFAQRFIRRLLEVEDISHADEELAVEYTKFKLRISNQLEQWVQVGDLVSDEVEAFHAEVFIRWQNEFRGAFRRCGDIKEVVDAALDLLTTLRRERFMLTDSELNTTLSNGELYYLSDMGRIGWHKDWKQND